MSNIFEESYELIHEFVSHPENSRLKAGTGRYSTLFRGTLFGSTKSSFVSQRLNNEPVKVLWLGSNPNVPDSLQNIVTGNNSGHFQDFITQKQSGHFSEVIQTSNSNDASPGWDPINRPNYHWRFYTDIFEQLFGSGHTLMANYVPWGSKDFSQFISQLSILDKNLLQRILDFATMLNLRLIESISPELVIVPKSLCRPQLKNSHLFSAFSQNVKSFHLDAKVPFKFSIYEDTISSNKIKFLVSPHPSYTTRLGKEHRESIQLALKNELQS
jgi:hypothetical protein